ncbi:MAG: hypothetical protein CBD16_08155 [Betaproteobacteria bacterium TMED156]|nr:MAG: hypothetical protein CBD16_08155 [Betaproteobacteria bacterium TMED156]
MKWEDKNFYQNCYAIPMDDLVQVWIETFHPFGVILVIWDAKNHFSLLNKCGILVKEVEAYNNKVVTVELPSVMDAYEVMDNIQNEGYSPFMQVYDSGKLLSDNIGPVV